MPNKTEIVVYDGRALSGDTDDAQVMFTADDMKEAKKFKGDFPADCAVYEYDLIEIPGKPTRLENERLLGTLGDL